MFVRILYSLVFVFFIGVAQVRAQAPQPGPAPPGGPDQKPPSDNPYADLTKSKDPKTKGLAERYGGLIKYQEWGTASGKAITAKYVSHDPDLKHVKLAVPKGTGKDRTVQEYDVAIEKLNKTSQSRVKQIDTLQKKLDELAAAEPKNGEAGMQQGPGAGPEAGPGGRAHTARGRYGRPSRGPEGTGAAPETAQAPGPQQPAAAESQAPAEDPSASEPDPLGFAELQPVSPPGAGPGPGPGPPTDSGPGTTPPAQPTR